MPTNLVFENRQSEHPNRRRLTIIEQQGNDMIVDIARAETSVSTQGTPLTAEILNNWNDTVNTSKNTADSALTAANEAKEKSENALSKATTAETNANTAKSSATSALNQVNALVRDVDISGINGTGTPSVSFISNSDGTKKLSFKNLKGEKGESGTTISYNGSTKQKLNFSLQGDTLKITVE